MKRKHWTPGSFLLLIATRTLSVGLFSLIGLAAGAQVQDGAEYKSGVLVLKTGQAIAIRGDYELTETEVHFTDSHGRYVTLPLSKVNINESNRRNMVSERSGRVEGPRNQIGAVTKVKRPRDDPAPTETPPASTPHQPNSADGLPALDDWRTLETLSDPMAAKELIQNGLTNAGPFLLAVFMALALSLLISFVTHIYILIVAYRDGSFWGLTLTLTYLSTWGSGLLNYIMGDSLPWFLTLSIQLLHYGLVFLFIMAQCHGSRLKYLLLWLSPVILLMLVLAKALLFG